MDQRVGQRLVPKFVMAVHLRHPDVLPELKAGAGTVWDKSGDTYQKHYEQVRTKDHPPTMDEWIATVDPVTRAKVQLNAVMKMIDNEKWGLPEQDAPRSCGPIWVAVPIAYLGSPSTTLSD